MNNVYILNIELSDSSKNARITQLIIYKNIFYVADLMIQRIHMDKAARNPYFQIVYVIHYEIIHFVDTVCK